MLKNIFRIFLLLFLSNCASPGTAFLGPVITGAKTGSVYQASLSYGSGKVINAIKDTSNNVSKKKLKNLYNSKNDSQPPVLIAILTSNVEINDIFEEEPLPWFENN